MLVVDDLGDGRLQCVFTEVPGRAPGELAIGKLGDVGHLPQAEVAGVSEDDRVEVRQQILGAWLSTARMLKATGEAGPGINFDNAASSSLGSRSATCSWSWSAVSGRSAS